MNSYIEKILKRVEERDGDKKEFLQCVKEVYGSLEKVVEAHPEYEKEYDWDEMVAWHSLEPTSCIDGRRRFTALANKKSGDKGTPKELISVMKQSPSKNIAIEMERLYLNKN